MIPLLALAACVAVPAASDKIVAGDLAPFSPAFANVNPAAFIGWAPAPGVRGIFSVAELRRTAARLGAPAVPDTPLCVERATAPLEPARILAAIQSQIPRGEIQLLDFSRALAPEGELIFPPNGLHRSAGAAYWSGYVRYATGRRFAVWAKVAMAVPAVVAAVDLQPGRPVEAGQLRVENRAELSGLEPIEPVVGKCPRRLIRAGTAILPQWLEAAPAIVRGDAVTVEVQSGAAHLTLDGRAETSAAVGQRITVRNPETEKRFFARVEAKGRVSVAAPGHEAKP
jgi:flagella basal body P-ring formation protein FlgA